MIENYYNHVVLVPLTELIKFAPCPFEEFIWFEENKDYRPVTRQEIKSCLDSNNLESTFFGSLKSKKHEVHRDWHIRRIAYLVKYPTKDPILIEMRSCYNGSVRPEMYDGFHRFAAAFYLDNKEIRSCISGVIGKHELFSNSTIIYNEKIII